MERIKGLESIIVISLALLVVTLRFHIDWPIYAAITLLCITLISKKLTILIGTFWFAFSHYFGMVMNYIIMFFIFYLILTPLAFFQRLSGTNHILKKRQSNSYFRARNHLFSFKDIKNPW